MRTTRPPSPASSRWCHSWLPRTHSHWAFPLPLPQFLQSSFHLYLLGRRRRAAASAWSGKGRRARTHGQGRPKGALPDLASLRAGGRRACDGFSSLSVSVCVLQGCTLQRPPPPPQLALWRKRSLQRPPAAAAIFARPPAVPARVVPGWRRESRVQTDDEWGPPGEQGEGLREPSLLLYIPVRRQAVGLEPGPLLLQSFPLLCFSYLSLRLHPRFALAFPVAVVRHSMHVHSCLGRR